MLFRRSSSISEKLAVLLAAALACGASALQAQAPRPLGFLAEHYDISATLDAAGQSIKPATVCYTETALGSRW